MKYLITKKLFDDLVISNANPEETETMGMITQKYPSEKGISLYRVITDIKDRKTDVYFVASKYKHLELYEIADRIKDEREKGAQYKNDFQQLMTKDG